MGSIKSKAILVCFVLSAFGFQRSFAQTFAEWFSQGKTQIKYLTQQIAALNACRISIEQGYLEAKNEWGLIGSLKNGEFLKHQAYYASLSIVNPQVSNAVHLTDVQSEQQDIISQFSAIRNVNGLTTEEQTYIGTVRDHILAECAKNLSDLQTVLSSGRLTMSDDERIKRINQLTSAIKDKYLFTCSFCNQVKMLAIQRNQENQSIQILNQLYGIN